jgi:hypothetical protein
VVDADDVVDEPPLDVAAPPLVEALVEPESSSLLPHALRASAGTIANVATTPASLRPRSVTLLVRIAPPPCCLRRGAEIRASALRPS